MVGTSFKKPAVFDAAMVFSVLKKKPLKNAASLSRFPVDNAVESGGMECGGVGLWRHQHG